VELARQFRQTSAGSDERNHELSIILGYSIFAILMLIALVLAFGQPGVSIEDLASMTVFP
jgi:hypothetical protein